MLIRSTMTVAALALAGNALASFGTLSATFDGVSPGARADYSLDGGDNWHESRAGVFNWTRTGGSYRTADHFTAFCIELGEHISGGSNYAYEVVDLEEGTDSMGGMGTTRANLIRELFGRFSTPAFNDPLTERKAVALQLCVWEIVHETRSSLDLARGRARFTSSNEDAFKLAQDYLKEITGDGPRDYTVVAMTAAGVQDQIIPGPGALALAGLGLIAAGRRRR